MADQFIVRRWLVDLGRLTAVARSEADAEGFVEAMAPMIAMRFPNEAFTSASLEAVAAECKYLPTYGELVGHMRNWWRENRPRNPTLSIPDNVVGLDEKNRQWLDFYYRREREGFAPHRNPDGSLTRPDIRDWRSHALSLIHQYAPDAWERITSQETA